MWCSYNTAVTFIKHLDVIFTVFNTLHGYPPLFSKIDVIIKNNEGIIK